MDMRTTWKLIGWILFLGGGVVTYTVFGESEDPGAIGDIGTCCFIVGSILLYNLSEIGKAVVCGVWALIVIVFFLCLSAKSKDDD